MTIAETALIERLRTRIVQLEKLVDDLMCWTVGAYVDGDLDQERSEAFRAHLATCLNCQNEVVYLASLANQFRSAKER